MPPLFSLGLLLVLGPARADEVQGTLREAEGHRVVHVWGSHREMGYAHGYLLAEEVREVFDGYALPLYGMSASEYESYLTLFLSMMEVPADLEDEARGLVEGATDALGSATSEALGRDLTWEDVIFVNAASDVGSVSFYCSSISAWGSATASDATLEGELAIARDLDWDYGSGEADLRDYNVVFAFEPTGADEQPWVAVGFPGYLGCLSCFNEAGIGAFQNVGNHYPSINDLDTELAPVPINLAMRTGIETWDFDGDGENTPDDVVEAVTAVGRLGTYDIHVVGPVDARDPPAVILECANGEHAVREPADDPLEIAEALAVTNHHRLLYEPERCSRYDIMEDLVASYDGELGSDRLWEVEREVAWEWGTSGTLQTMRLFPAERRIDVAFSSDEALSADQEPVTWTWDELFGDAGPSADSGDTAEGAANGTGACGCAGGSGAGAGPVLPLLLLWRRRRRPRF